MSKLEINGYWNVMRGRLKQHVARLTDDDYHLLQGRQEERLGRMQKRAGRSREAVEQAVSAAVNEAVYSFCRE